MTERDEHWKEQARKRYRFLVGEWGGARRAKCIGTGEFVSIEEVKKQLDEEID